MKKLSGPLPSVLCLLLLSSVLCLLSSCTTPRGSELDRLLAATKLAAYIGTAESLAVHPEWRTAFQVAREELKIMETSENLDLPTLLAIVHRLPVKELRSDHAAIIITSATILLADFDFGGTSVPVNRLGQLQKVAGAIRQGIDLGLGQ
jgi:hypothetical protein